MDTLITIFQVAVGIGLLIFIHEAGHYIAARAAGVRVEVFSLGFGPRLCGFQVGDTDYRLSAVPVGGYVRVAGEDPTRREGLADHELYAKSFTARALFFSGGVLMNLLFALVAFPIVFHRGVEFVAPVVGSVSKGGAAWQAGLEPGDRILSVDDKPMYSFANLAVEVALAGSRGCTLSVERDEGQPFDVEILPRYSTATGLFELGASPDEASVTIRAVDEDGPAAGSGLEPGDRIVGVGGERLPPREVTGRLSRVEPGERVELTVRRGDDVHEIVFETAERESDRARIGVRQAQPKVVAVRPHETVERLGLRKGDVVLEVGGQPFFGWKKELFTDGEGPLTVTVERDDLRLPLEASLSADERQALIDNLAFGPIDDRVRVTPDPDTPASRAGILGGDVIERVAGERIRSWPDLVRAVEDVDDEPLRMQIRRGDETLAIEVRPERAELIAFGVDFDVQNRMQTFQRDSVGGAIEAGMVASVDLVKQLYVTLKRIVTGDVAARNLGGIITISRVSYAYASSGWERFLYFLALLSINLAFINVLPIPVLDGGHLMFLLIERIKGSPVSATVLNYSQILGLVFVLALLVFVTYHDIARLLP